MIAPGTLLFHDNSPQAGRSLLFASPRKVLTTHDPSEAAALLAEAQDAFNAGAYIAGALSYELGHIFEERLNALLPSRTTQPLLWLGIYDSPSVLDAKAAQRFVEENADGRTAQVSDVRLSMTRAEYEQAFARVMDYIHAGDVYQINLTMLARFALSGDPLALYRDLCAKQPVAHGAFLKMDEASILSLSPELFIERRGQTITTRPMKGTIRRGKDEAEDEALKTELRLDEKSRAENLMIVDLLRNDLGRIADMGSVEVERLFEIETYKSLHQMTSTVHARLPATAGLDEVLHALFPCGSVTGAPKIRAMQIIHELESGPRGIYCGSLGWIAPNGDFSFNVAIRTAYISDSGEGEIGVGGGIVADSNVSAEYDEALLKLSFFAKAPADFGLIETLLFDETGFHLLDRHIDRLEASAKHFGFVFSCHDILNALNRSMAGKAGAHRVRLVLAQNGKTDITSSPLAPMPSLSFMVAAQHTRSDDVFLQHKTTRRQFYDDTRKAAADTYGVQEVIFLNERGELTEGSFTNLFIEKNGRLFTPALACGLLPGTLRAELIAKGEAYEAVLTMSDLDSADAVFLGNSVRGLIPAQRVRF